jgi:DNA repair exonuclease SbcCD ATPase subunit
MKKVAFWTIAVAAGLLVAGLAFPRLGSHICTAWNKVTHRLDNAVPADWEIARLHDELAKIEGDIKKAFGPIADQAVAVQNLQKDIKDGQARLDAQKQRIRTLRESLDQGTEKIVLGENKYTADQVKTKLTHEFDTYKVADQALKSKQELLVEKQAALDAARARLTEMRSSKEQLEVELAKLEADLQRVRLEEAKAKNKVEFDDSRLGQIKEDMKKLSDRIKASEFRLAEEARFSEVKDADVNQTVRTREVVKEVDEYFGNNGDKVATEK